MVEQRQHERKELEAAKRAASPSFWAPPIAKRRRVRSELGGELASERVSRDPPDEIVKMKKKFQHKTYEL